MCLKRNEQGFQRSSNGLPHLKQHFLSVLVTDAVIFSTG